MIVIAGTITVDPAKAADFSAAVEGLVAKSKAEEGCAAYGFWLSPTEPGVFHVFEEWVDGDAVAAHGSTEHYTSFTAGLAGFGVRGADLNIYEASSKRPLGG